jgi:hypothetical protein
VPELEESPIHQLHPTQLTLGMLEVKQRKHDLEQLGPGARRRFLQSHPMPVVVGPEGRLYLTDHHHLGRAALEAGIDTCFVHVEARLSGHAENDFWQEMDARGWVHPLDQNGVRHRYSSIPRHLEGLVDDVYRSLARYVRAAGGYEKTPAAFAEFVWADFFRRLIAVEDVRADFAAATERALKLARSRHAESLPGYAGTVA